MTKSLKVARNVKPVGAPSKAAPKAKAKTAAKPEVVAKPRKAAPVVHNFATSWGQSSTVLNARVSRQPVNFSRFGTLTDAPLTDRDRKSLDDLRRSFQKGAFARANIDTGILRRLGERGMLAHVSGSDVAADAQFRLTDRAFTKDALAA